MENRPQNPVPSSENSDLGSGPIRVLVVDDDKNLCSMLKDILEEYDLKAVSAETDAEALKLMPDFKPHVALVDFRLGDVTGIEVAQHLKGIDADLPVILMTAYPSLDLAVKAIQSDIYDFLAKPVDNTYLLRSVSKANEKRLLLEENKRLIASLKTSNSSLEKLNALKSKFLSIVTHDLRTPLTSIRGFAEMLRDSGLSEEDKTRCLNAIETASERMNGLISNLLDMVSIEAGKLRVEKAKLDYTSVFKELKETLQPVAESKKVRLAWEFPPDPVWIEGDSSRLVQLLTNLIGNAFKHTPENGRITVRSSRSHGQILTEVADNGEGISPEHQSRLFEQFYQVEASASRREGLGLGLMISKEIVHAHRGDIGVSSEGPGKGSRFWFSIPLLP